MFLLFLVLIFTFFIFVYCLSNVYILFFFFFFSSRRRHTRYWRDWSSDVCSSDLSVVLSKEVLRDLVRVCGASEFFGEILTGSPTLIPSVATRAAVVSARDQRALMRAAVDKAEGFGAELSALRRAWTHLIVEIGARDVAGELEAGESNRLQASLAAASINVALLVARREMARAYGRLAAGPRLAALGLGRLGKIGRAHV